MGLRLFAKNVVRLFGIDLKVHKKSIRRHDALEGMLDNLKYEIADQIGNIVLPHVIKAQETIRLNSPSPKRAILFRDE